MNRLALEVIFCVAFIYLIVTTFTAEIFDGFFRSFICIFGPASLQETEDQNRFPTFYYSYLILLSILGNFMFILSLFIYGPAWRKTKIEVSLQGSSSQSSASNLINKTINCTHERPTHICILTRYDLYALIVLLFITAQYISQLTLGYDNFKVIEARVYMKTVHNYKTNYSDENCFDQWCDNITGRQALRGIHDFQQKMECCGWNDATDWLKANYTLDAGYSGHGKELQKNMQILPHSCCDKSSTNCSMSDVRRFKDNCRNYRLPIRGSINPTEYSNFCYGLYPLYKLIALIAYQFSFKKIFDGSALLLKVHFLLPSTAGIV